MWDLRWRRNLGPVCKLGHTEGTEKAYPLSVDTHEHGVYVGLVGPSHTRGTGRLHLCGR